MAGIVPDDAVEKWLSELPDIAKSESLSRLQQLTTDTKRHRVQFLCGAGMSKASGLPLAADLVLMMAGEMLDGQPPAKPYQSHWIELANRYPLEAVAEGYVAKYDSPRLKTMLREALEGMSATPHAGHRALEYLATQRYINKVYTTNFDTLIEDGFSTRGRTIVDETADEITIEQSKGNIPVLHLHGTLNRDLLIAESSTYALNTPLGNIMRGDMVTNRFVWVGYSLNDVDLRAMYLSMRDMLSTANLAKRPFIIHPLSDKKGHEEMEWRFAEAVWTGRGAMFIPGRAETFLAALQLQVRRSSARDVVRAVILKKGGNPDDQSEIDQVWNDARELAAETLLGDEIDAVNEIATAFGID